MMDIKRQEEAFEKLHNKQKKIILGKLVKINQGLQIAISDRYLESGNGRYFYITNEFLKNPNQGYYIEHPSKNVICNVEDILMTRTGNTGQVVTNIEGVFHNNFFKIDYGDIIKNYMFYYLKSTKTQNNIMKYAGTSTIPDLNHSDFYRLIFPMLDKSYQEKIAKFLTSLDSLIQKQEEYIEELKVQKKGYSQKIFDQKLRFKGFDEKLIYTELKKITKIGSSNITDKELLNEGLYQVYGASGKQGYLNDFMFEDEKIAIVKDGSGVGRLFMCEQKSSIIGTLNYFEPKNEINTKYLFNVLKTLDYLKYKVGSTIPHIYFRDYSVEKVLLPSLKEQEQIGNFLNTLDDKIELQEQKLEKLKLKKKYYLNKIFQ